MELVIKADKRDIVGKKNAILRSEGKIPAVIYGHGFKSLNLAVNQRDFVKVFTQAGQSKIIGLSIGQDKPVQVLIHDVQYHPISSLPLHIDFYQVKMDEKIKAKVPLRFVGEAKAVFEKGGSFITNIEEVEVETLPADLPSEIEVDISKLDDFDKAIHISDLKLPPRVELLEEESELVAKVEPPRSDEELAELEEEITEEIPTAEGEGEEGKPTEKEAAEEEEGKSTESEEAANKASEPEGGK